jgi:hypothetical protein
VRGCGRSAAGETAGRRDEREAQEQSQSHRVAGGGWGARDHAAISGFATAALTA